LAAGSRRVAAINPLRAIVSAPTGAARSSMRPSTVSIVGLWDAGQSYDPTPSSPGESRLHGISSCGPQGFDVHGAACLWNDSGFRGAFLLSAGSGAVSLAVFFRRHWRSHMLLFGWRSIFPMDLQPSLQCLFFLGSSRNFAILQPVVAPSDRDLRAGRQSRFNVIRSPDLRGASTFLSRLAIQHTGAGLPVRVRSWLSSSVFWVVPFAAETRASGCPPDRARQDHPRRSARLLPHFFQSRRYLAVAALQVAHIFLDLCNLPWGATGCAAAGIRNTITNRPADHRTPESAVTCALNGSPLRRPTLRLELVCDIVETPSIPVGARISQSRANRHWQRADKHEVWLYSVVWSIPPPRTVA